MLQSSRDIATSAGAVTAVHLFDLIRRYDNSQAHTRFLLNNCSDTLSHNNLITNREAWIFSHPCGSEAAVDRRQQTPLLTSLT
ncbi:hypothetical protein EVAR_60903_1 [Eumeta japonica]|uniref:Uncharacterized protein n=1 Tax=Eumeta variegata TaxID=151549 RepID=A0A4C1ZDR9_EUMVA|nr:hypothetical protein EVAR_60903_1 [Eumeta japonica]